MNGRYNRALICALTALLIAVGLLAFWMVLR